MVNAFLAVAICTIHIELSYSPPFGANTNYFIVVFKFLYLFYEEIMIKVGRLLVDHRLGYPFT